MPIDVREVKESPLVQGVNERVIYSLDVTPWGNNPTSVVVTVLDNTDNDADETASRTTGSPSVVGNIITLPTIYQLEDDHQYSVFIRFTIGSNIFEVYARIQANR